MISDEQLSAAAREALLHMEESVPQTPHEFSPAFERKLRSLRRRDAHRRILSVVKSTAAALLFAATAFSCVFLLSAKVQAATVDWVREKIGIYTQYSPDGSEGGIHYEYLLSGLSDEYEPIAELKTDGGFLFLYQGGQGHQLSFSYVHPKDGSALRVNIEGFAEYRGMVGESVAQIYISPVESKNSVIVWEDVSNGTLFSIFYAADEQTLLALARQVVNN